jgi:hypothetical protein
LFSFVQMFWAGSKKRAAQWQSRVGLFSCFKSIKVACISSLPHSVYELTA